MQCFLNFFEKIKSKCHVRGLTVQSQFSVVKDLRMASC